MEFLREDDIDGVESPEVSKDIAIINSADKKGSTPGDFAVELEKPEAWPDHKSGARKETSDKWLYWLKVIGKHRHALIREVHSSSISEKKVLPFAVLLIGGLYLAVAANFYLE